jgi:hypothetical protein
MSPSIRPSSGKYIEKQARNHLSVEPSGYVGDSRQSNFVVNAAVQLQPNHHVLGIRAVHISRSKRRTHRCQCP